MLSLLDSINEHLIKVQKAQKALSEFESNILSISDAIADSLGDREHDQFVDEAIALLESLRKTMRQEVPLLAEPDEQDELTPDELTPLEHFPPEINQSQLAARIGKSSQWVSTNKEKVEKIHNRCSEVGEPLWTYEPHLGVFYHGSKSKDMKIRIVKLIGDQRDVGKKLAQFGRSQLSELTHDQLDRLIEHLEIIEEEKRAVEAAEAAEREAEGFNEEIAEDLVQLRSGQYAYLVRVIDDTYHCISVGGRNKEADFQINSADVEFVSPSKLNKTQREIYENLKGLHSTIAWAEEVEEFSEEFEEPEDYKPSNGSQVGELAILDDDTYVIIKDDTNSKLYDCIALDENLTEFVHPKLDPIMFLSKEALPSELFSSYHKALEIALGE